MVGYQLLGLETDDRENAQNTPQVYQKIPGKYTKCLLGIADIG